MVKKQFYVGKNLCKVVLNKVKDMWIVYVDGEVYYKSANELFAVQVFQSI